MINRWQAARGYPKSGYLNKLQHKALLTEIVAAAPTASSSDEERPQAPGHAAAAAARRSTSSPAASSGSQPGPDPAGAGRFIGGVMGGMLR